MTRFLRFLLLLSTFLLLLPFRAAAQDVFPSVAPAMTIIAADGSETEEMQYDGSAPATARFTANPADLGSFEALYEWTFTRQGEAAPFLTRYEEDTEFVFAQSGSFIIKLSVSFVRGNDTIQYAMDEPFIVTISESKLEVPNAFTPNGDGINDVFRVKEGYQSIVSFEARIFSRWGKKLYEWRELDGGWDGKSGGSKVPDGAYYLSLQAKGADGKVYDIKKVINLLRGFTENETGGTE